jgi:hypothetical protein
MHWDESGDPIIDNDINYPDRVGWDYLKIPKFGSVDKKPTVLSTKRPERPASISLEGAITSDKNSRCRRSSSGSSRHLLTPGASR